MGRTEFHGTVKPETRDHVLRCERGQRNIHSLCSADHEQVWQLYLVDPYSGKYAYIHTVPIHTAVPIYICIMYHEYSSTYVLSVHSYYDTVSEALYHPSSFRQMRARAYNKSARGRPENTMNPALIQEFHFFCEPEQPKNLQVLCKKSYYVYRSLRSWSSRSLNDANSRTRVWQYELQVEVVWVGQSFMEVVRDGKKSAFSVSCMETRATMFTEVSHCA